MNDYYGITYPEVLDDIKILDYWRDHHCIVGWHLFDEVETADEHYLHCDACGLSVYIERIEK